MAWLLIVLLHLFTPAEATHLCEEVKVELDRAVREGILKRKDAKAIYKRCLIFQEHD